MQSFEGQFIFDDIVVVSPPGEYAEASLFTSAVSAIGVPTDNFIKLEFYMRECIIGEVM